MPPKPPPRPEGCRSLAEHERALTEMAELLEAKAKMLLEGDARVGISAGREAANVAVRARREAAEMSFYRERLEHLNRMRALMEMQNSRQATRPPLRRKPESE